MALRVTMDFFQHRYYRLNKTMMTLIGQWPYQSFRTKCCFRAVIIYINASELLSRMLDIVEHIDDFNILLESGVSLLADIVCVTNLIVLMSNSRRTSQLLNRIRTDWRVWAPCREVNILHEYTEQGRKINILLTAIVYCAVFIDGTSLSMARVIDILLKNDTVNGKFPARVDNYRIDTQKYYFYVMLYYCAIAVMILMVMIVNNVMLITYAKHACGIFAMLGRKLERIGNNDAAIVTFKSVCTIKRDIVKIVWCIDRHNDAIEYANMIEEINSWNIGFAMLFGVILLVVLCLQIVISTEEPEVIARLMIFTFSIIFGFIMDCYVAQNLMDHSIDIGFYIYNNQWYGLSHDARKIVQLMMTRCIVPCQLTAGKILILSMNTCGRTLRTALSYFMILRSTRGL